MNLIHTTGFGSSVEIATQEGTETIFGTLKENFGEQWNVSALELPGQGKLEKQSLTNRHQVFLALDEAMSGGQGSNVVTLNSLTTPVVLDAFIYYPTLQHRLAGVLGMAAAVEPEKALKGQLGKNLYTALTMPILGRVLSQYAKHLAKKKVKNGVNLNVTQYLRLAKICEQEYRPAIKANRVLTNLPQLYLHNEGDEMVLAPQWDESWKNPHAELHLFEANPLRDKFHHGLELHTEIMLEGVRDRLDERATTYKGKASDLS